ncbi:MAG: twin-arginine translocation signal domain-containing protein, partial [Candidatus Rokuibacteriota bacterium]
MKLRRVDGHSAHTHAPPLGERGHSRLDRRAFLKAAGVGGLGAVTAMAPALAREVEAQAAPPAGPQAPKLDQFKT